MKTFQQFNENIPTSSGPLRASSGDNAILVLINNQLGGL